MRDFHELDVWQRAHRLVLEIYRLSKHMPKEEAFGMITQVRRAAVSVATRIAEGAGVDGNIEFVGHLQRAKAGASELEYLLLLSRDLEYLSEENYTALNEETIAIKKMLSGLIRRL